MAGVSLADVQTFGNLKELYHEEAQYQDHILSSFHNFLKHAGPEEVNYSGQFFNIPNIFTLNESYGAINDGERLPLSGFQKGAFAKWRPKFHYASIQATMPAATRGHAGGMAGGGKYFDDLVKGSFMTFLSNSDFDTYGNGRGFRATVETATPAASNFTLESSARVRGDMILDWYSSDYSTKRGTIKIDKSGISKVESRVYIDSSFLTGQVPAGATAGDVLVVNKALDPGEPTDGRYAGGYQRVVDNSLSTFGEISPSTWRLWTATNFDAAGAKPNWSLLQDFVDTFYQISGTYANRMVFHPSFKKGYIQGFLGQREFTSNNFDTGANKITMDFVKMGKDAKNTGPSRMEMLEDFNADPDKTLIYHHDAICIATDYANAPQLADEDGTEFRNQHGYDAMHGYIRYWWNIVVKKRNGVGQISGWDKTGTVI